MNRTQKMAWMTVICAGVGILLSSVTFTILYLSVGFPVAQTGLAWMGLAGFSGFAPLIFKKETGAVQSDERDRLIQLRSTRAGFAASYFVFGALAMGIWIVHGPARGQLVDVNILPQIFMAAFITAFFVQSLTTLILYGKDNKAIEGGAA